MKDPIDQILYLYDRICPSCKGSLTRIPRRFRWRCENPQCDVGEVQFDTYGSRVLNIEPKPFNTEFRARAPPPPEEKI